MPHHVVVDGSNLATEGRPAPSLRQLLDAVEAYQLEQPTALITVVVDATFGHRIDPAESAQFETMVNRNELVCPPAGAIGRGDAFVLSIANKVGATILSNDSFQEFHGTHGWLFDEGRLVGGKPVPHIGWVFVSRNPVRGPTSRKAVSDAKRKTERKSRDTVVTGSVEASQPMPVPKAPPPGARPPHGRRGDVSDVAVTELGSSPDDAVASTSGRGRRGRGKGASQTNPGTDNAGTDKAGTDKAGAGRQQNEPRPTPKSTGVNDLLAFLTFVGSHPVGTAVVGVVEQYSSHGAYVAIGDVKGYVPLRLMSNPAPRSAREFMKIGESVSLVVESFAPPRRSIDLATPAMASMVEPAKTPKGAKNSKPAKAVKAPTVAAAPDAAKPEAAKPSVAKPRMTKPRVAQAETTTPAVVATEPVPTAVDAPKTAKMAKTAKTVKTAKTAKAAEAKPTKASKANTATTATTAAKPLKTSKQPKVSPTPAEPKSAPAPKRVVKAAATAAAARAESAAAAPAPTKPTRAKAADSPKPPAKRPRGGSGA
jgi:hypothetical protein